MTFSKARILALVFVLPSVLAFPACSGTKDSANTDATNDASVIADGNSVDTADSVDTTGSDSGITCLSEGVTYPVGSIVGGSGCKSCVCLPDGTIGHCTGACR